MSFQSALSGLNASSRSLDVIGNNIANANTVGMKSSRAEFSDIVAASLGSGSGGGAGIGVELATTSQLFSQGNVNITGNDLDVAINGGGFFELRLPDKSAAYTRDGQFKLDKLGNVVTNKGANVMGYPTDIKGVPTSTTIQPLQLPTAAPIGAKQTAAITAEFNLDARAPILPVVSPIATTYGTAMTAYDSQGVPVPVNLYFSKVTPVTAGTDEWAVYQNPAGATVGSLVFDASGALTSSTVGALTLTPPAPSIVPPFPVTVDVSKATQFGAGFAVSNLTQDGYTSGELIGLKIGVDGVITARYSNGQTQAAGQVALADFRNVQGLSPTGGGNWIETYASGQPVQGSPGAGKFGVLTSGALEESNIDLTAELVNMMTAQRAYQANAQTIKTQDQIMSTLVNLR
ncbi:flagellar hook protein FlgE [Rhodoferax sp. UBA5149]|uniref:flagellar hook protein FlgE n=1 Tax=Rhodoferax sp. UBA5149 TaxID=1947379 RepID=UPI0025FDA576|nr:flagellar hook protein FlgE [Rhodoferax sp. UBA5149]